MTLNPNWYLNATGQFQQIGGGQIGISTTTTTGFLTFLTAATTANVNLSSTGTTFTILSVTQGTSGTWLATAVLTIADGVGTNLTYAKLWDGTTVTAAGSARVEAVSPVSRTLTLTGIFQPPAGNITLSAFSNSVNAVAVLNASGYSKDCTLTAIRIG